jgi:twitching motility protein PilT
VHQIYSAMQAGGRFGMQTMDMHLSQLVKAGTITQQIAFERCHDPEELQRLVGSAPIQPTGASAMSMSGGMLMGGDGYA